MDNGTVTTVINMLIVAFMFGIVKTDTIWLKRKADADSKKFGGVFKKLEDHEVRISIIERSKQDD